MATDDKVYGIFEQAERLVKRSLTYCSKCKARGCANNHHCDSWDAVLLTGSEFDRRMDVMLRIILAAGAR